MPRSTVHVLLIDDSEIFRSTLADTLAELLGATVTQAADGPSGLGHVERGEPVDVVLVDLRMPGIDGLEVSRRLLERPARPHVVVMSAFTDGEAGQRAREVGVDGFFCKTDGIAALLAQLERIAALPG